MSDDSWEARMSKRAALREAARAALREANPMPDQHQGHHMHLKGSAVLCSCGADFGTTCVTFPPEFWELDEAGKAEWFNSLVCSRCGERGVVALGD